MREQWAAAFAARARAYWTPVRLEALLGDKRPLARPDEAAVVLRALGLLRRDASMSPDRVRKYRQINHMAALLQPSLRALMASGRPLRLLDAGCGRAYLTTLLAWCFERVYEHPACLLGVDRDAGVIEASRRQAAQAGLEARLRFTPGVIADLDVAAAWGAAFGASVSAGGLDAVLALHACDTATDDAIALGLQEGATLIAVAPCCQAELARGWATLAEAGAEGAFAAAWTSPHLRRQHAATLTDTLRLLLLRGAGYEASAIEFVASAHTPRNTLLRALRGPRPVDPAALASYVALRQATGGVGLALERRLPAPARAVLEALSEL